MKGKNDELKKILMKLFSPDQIENLFLYISNPARYPQIIDWMKRCKIILVNNQEKLSQIEYTTVNNWLDDELTFAILITQQAKCDPFKFINFKRFN